MNKFEESIAKINKKFNNEALISLGTNILCVERIPFPSPSASYPMYGGAPVGRVIQISGLESSGKTTLALTLIAEYQSINPTKYVAYFDVEHTLDKIWAQKLGVNLEKMYYVDPIAMSGEVILNLVSEVLELDGIGLVIIDSIAALSTQEEFDSKDMTKVSYQSMAKPLSKWFRVAIEQLSRNKSTLICINQLRANIGNQWQPWVEPAGKALAYASSMTLRCGTRRFINEEGVEGADSMEDPQGIRIKFKVAKNKITVNNRGGGYVTIRFRSGVDVISDTLDVAILFGLVKQSGSWFQLIDNETGEVLVDKVQGKTKLRKWFHDNPNEFYKYRELVNKALSKYEDFTGAPELKLIDDNSEDLLDESKIKED